MKILTDIVLAIPIGIIYNALIYKFNEIINSNLEYNEKVQRNLIICFFGGVIGLIAGLKLFDKNRAIKYGICFGSIMLLFYTLFYNWCIIANDTKLFIIILSFVALLWYANNIN
jgi:hypothetical protein